MPLAQGSSASVSSMSMGPDMEPSARSRGRVGRKEGEAGARDPVGAELAHPSVQVCYLNQLGVLIRRVGRDRRVCRCHVAYRHQRCEYLRLLLLLALGGISSACGSDPSTEWSSAGSAGAPGGASGSPAIGGSGGAPGGSGTGGSSSSGGSSSGGASAGDCPAAVPQRGRPVRGNTNARTLIARVKARRLLAATDRQSASRPCPVRSSCAAAPAGPSARPAASASTAVPDRWHAHVSTNLAALPR